MIMPTFGMPKCLILTQSLERSSRTKLCPMHIYFFRWHLPTMHLSMWGLSRMSRACFRSCPRNQLCRRYDNMISRRWIRYGDQWPSWREDLEKSTPRLLARFNGLFLVLTQVGWVRNDMADTQSPCFDREEWGAQCNLLATLKGRVKLGFFWIHIFFWYHIRY